MNINFKLKFRFLMQEKVRCDNILKDIVTFINNKENPLDERWELFKELADNELVTNRCEFQYFSILDTQSNNALHELIEGDDVGFTELFDRVHFGNKEEQIEYIQEALDCFFWYGAVKMIWSEYWV